MSNWYGLLSGISCRLNLLDINDHSDRIERPFGGIDYQGIERLRVTKKLAVAYYNLSVMLEAGMPILKALNTVVAGSKGNLKNAFATSSKGISAGDSLAETMSKYPRIFAHLDVMLVEVADMSGNLPQSLKLLSQWYEFRNRLRNIILSGLMLPLVIIHFAALIIPLPRLILGQIGVVGYIFQVVRTLTYFYLPAGIILFIYRLTPNTGLLRRLLDALILTVPVLGQAIRQLALSRYCQAFGMLYEAGIPIMQCAQKASSITGNAVMTELLKGGAESARAGKSVYEGFSRKLPTDFLQLWQIGEETGELDKTVKRLGDNTRQTAEWLLVEFSRWLVRVVYFLVCALLAIKILRMGVAVFGAAYGTV